MGSQDGARPARPVGESQATVWWCCLQAVGSDSLVPTHSLILGTFLSLYSFTGGLEFPYLQNGNNYVLTITRDIVWQAVNAR